MANQLVPFGKYKGQPLEVLLADTQYMAWLSEQPWVKERYPVVQTLIVNNFGEPDETPEHNAFQGRFYDVDYLSAFLSTLHPALRTYIQECGTSDIRVESEVRGWDIKLDLSGFADSLLNTGLCSEYGLHVFIELKPSIGDDFPSVLRQIKNNKDRVTACTKTYWTGNSIYRYGRWEKELRKDREWEGSYLYVLVYGSYTGSGVGEDVMRKQFKNSDITAVCENAFYVAEEVV